MTKAFEKMAALLDVGAASNPHSAGFAVVFGPTTSVAVEAVAQLIRERLVPVVVVASGRGRREESETFARLVREAGARSGKILIGMEGADLAGQVEGVWTLIEARLREAEVRDLRLDEVRGKEARLLAARFVPGRKREVQTAIAVVEWWNRRALHALAAGMPNLLHIQAVTFSSQGRDGRIWTQPDQRQRLEKEYSHLRSLLDRGELPELLRDDRGWYRADTPPVGRRYGRRDVG